MRGSFMSIIKKIEGLKNGLNYHGKGGGSLSPGRSTARSPHDYFSVLDDVDIFSIVHSSWLRLEL
jgi:hypothetical protein